GPSSGVRGRKGKAEWKNQKTDSGTEHRGDDAPRKDSELPMCPTKKWRRDKKKIDRQVWKYQERHERNRAFPLKIECADIGALRRDPIAAAVNDQKQNRQPGGGQESFNAHLEIARHTRRVGSTQ